MKQRFIALLTAGIITMSCPTSMPYISFRINKKPKKVSNIKISTKYKRIQDWINKCKQEALHKKWIEESNRKLDLEIKKRKEKELIKTRGEKRTFILTYYSASTEECGNSLGITASGTRAVEGRTIAVPRSIPFGSKIRIKGHEYIAEDTGNPKYICELADGTIRVDIFVSDKSHIPERGVEKVEGYVIRK